MRIYIDAYKPRKKSAQRVDKTPEARGQVDDQLANLGIDPSLVKKSVNTKEKNDEATEDLLNHDWEWHANQPIIGRDW